MRKMIVAAMFLTALVPALPAPAAEPFNWQGYVAPDQTLEVRGINGGIRVVEGSTEVVEITATIRGADADRVRIDVVPVGTGILICAIYPSSDPSRPNWCGPDGSVNQVNTGDTRVEFLVKVPPKIGLKLMTMNGMVDVHVSDNAVDAMTMNGSIVISTSGQSKANAMNGSLLATLGPGWKGPAEFHTMNGSIEAAFAEDANADVKASTLVGSITTDFPLTVKKGFIGSSIDGRIGSGGPAVSLSTMTGSIHLRKQ